MNKVEKLTRPQHALLVEIINAGELGMVVPGTKGSTARALRDALLIETEPRIGNKPPKTKATPRGIATAAAGKIAGAT